MKGGRNRPPGRSENSPPTIDAARSILDLSSAAGARAERPGHWGASCGPNALAAALSFRFELSATYPSDAARAHLDFVIVHPVWPCRFAGCRVGKALAV